MIQVSQTIAQLKNIVHELCECDEGLTWSVRVRAAKNKGYAKVTQ